MTERVEHVGDVGDYPPNVRSVTRDGTTYSWEYR